MIDLAIPGFGWLKLHAAVFDFNGTLALDGELLPGVAERMHRLADQLDIYVVTGDTHGTATKQLQSLPCKAEILQAEGQAKAKQAFHGRLPLDGVAAIGNGRNDLHMLQCAQLAIAVMGSEGMATEIMVAADLVVTDIHAAFDLLLHPRRLLAGLRA
ncbi:MAG: ATPase P [Cupriavidus sp.]|jgi:P-type E1-E2 ATPase|uniref:HAD family hydrolase n=1 Tax=Cupriavidus TaxID=106589 RepID=UPI000C40EF8E|nr:hypothetical protein [Cupriavidus pauculus]MBU70162.1 ATPase P [Cupriavidus sp.]MCM3609418.1 hypothetical protein [Cupriavidus pauculus]